MICVFLLVLASAACAGGRVVIIGDVHGDVEALKESIELGGEGEVVQMGDVVDRGPVSDVVMEYVMSRKGEMVNLMGNHELLSLQGSSDYAHHEELSRLGVATRTHLFGPTGKYGQYIISNFKPLHRVNSTVFVHAGLTPQHARLGVAELNKQIRQAIENGGWSDDLLTGKGPLWYRGLLNKATAGSCIELYEVLKFLSIAEGVKIDRLVVGHTIQSGQKVAEYCKGGLLAVDVGMSNGTLIGDKRRAATIIDDTNKVTIRYSGRPGTVPGPSWWDWDEPNGKSRGLVNQGLVIISFLATILTPCVAAASVAFLVKMAKKLRFPRAGAERSR